MGRDAVAVTETDDDSVGMNHWGDPTTSGRARPEAWLKGASETVSLVLSRGSKKKSSAWVPLLVIVTGTVTGVPAGRVVLVLSGSAGALTFTLLNLTVPVNACETSSPTTGSAKSTMSVHVPEAGFAVYAVSESPLLPLM